MDGRQQRQFTPARGAGSATRRSMRLSSAAVTPVATSETHHVPPACRSRPPNSAGYAGQAADGTSNGRLVSSSLIASSRNGTADSGDRSNTTVHTTPRLASRWTLFRITE